VEFRNSGRSLRTPETPDSLQGFRKLQNSGKARGSREEWKLIGSPLTVYFVTCVELKEIILCVLYCTFSLSLSDHFASMIRLWFGKDSGEFPITPPLGDRSVPEM
jgi:hypothetical protein